MDNYVEHLITYGYLDPRLKQDLPSVKRAVRLYKSFFRDDIIGIAADNADKIFDDGELDDFTKSHMALPRCGHKDFLGGEPLGGSGSWPMGCHNSAPFHQVNVYFDLSGMPSWWVPVLDQVFDLVNAAYSDMGCRLNRVTTKSAANITVTWERGNGWIGLAQVGRNHRCSTVYWTKFDNRYGSSFELDQLINQLCMLVAHEFGHNFGFSHSRGGIMNPTLSRFRFTPTSWRGDPYESSMIRWFGGKPVDSPPVSPTTTSTTTTTHDFFTTTTSTTTTHPSQEGRLLSGWVMTTDGPILTGLGNKPTNLIVGGKLYRGLSL